MSATQPKTVNGWKVELLMIWPARERSTKPITEASEVFLTICTMKPTVGGVAILMACGRITLVNCSKRLKPRHSEASHCVLGTAWMQPRQISPRNAAQ